MAHRGQIGQGAFAALGGGGPAIVPTDGSDAGIGGGGGLFIESPPASGHNPLNQNQMPPAGRYGHNNVYGAAGAALDSNLTIRVFLRVLNSEEVEDAAPSKLSKEQLQALFKELMEKSPQGTQEGTQHPINYDGADQVYIDVRN